MRSRPWTADDVCRELPNAFRKLPSVPIFAPHEGVTLPAIGVPRRALDPTLLLNATALVFGARSRTREHFLTWARMMAHGQNQEWAEYRRGWPEELGSASKFKRLRRKWCELTAAELNRILELRGPNDTDGRCAAA